MICKGLSQKGRTGFGTSKKRSIVPGSLVQIQREVEPGINQTERRVTHMPAFFIEATPVIRIDAKTRIMEKITSATDEASPSATRWSDAKSMNRGK